MIGLNDAGDVAIAFQTEAPDGTVAGGLYRWSHITQDLSAAVVPNVTPVPGGGLFLGVVLQAAVNSSGSIGFTD